MFVLLFRIIYMCTTCVYIYIYIYICTYTHTVVCVCVGSYVTFRVNVQSSLESLESTDKSWLSASYVRCAW